MVGKFWIRGKNLTTYTTFRILQDDSIGSADFWFKVPEIIAKLIKQRVKPEEFKESKNFSGNILLNIFLMR